MVLHVQALGRGGLQSLATKGAKVSVVIVVVLHGRGASNDRNATRIDGRRLLVLLGKLCTSLRAFP